MWVLVAGLGLVASFAGGCPADGKSCISDEDCNEGGQCEPVGACSMPDEDCATGRRYDDDAPSGRGGQCVEGFGTTTGAVPPPYEDPAEASDESSADDSTEDPEPPTITLGPDFEFVTPGVYADTTVSSPQGTVEDPDVLWLEIYGPVSGTFPLDADYVGCEHCILLVVDGVTEMLATQGEISIDVASAPGESTVVGLSGIRFVEVEIDPGTLEPTLVEDGQCATMEDVEDIALPWWTCDPTFYAGSDGCDCGCGVVDTDCADANAAWCIYCLEGSCGADDDCAAVDLDNNAICTEPVWNCPVELYDDGTTCHCGCGQVDPDCLTTAVGSCDECSAPGSCVPVQANGECVGQINPDRNWLCTPVPGWTCEVKSYGDLECDCGCGAVDIDCDPGQPCETCDAIGSCSMEPCPGTIDPMDTTTCTMN